MDDQELDLTENEGTLLALVQREQPLTAYQIGRIYEASPVSNFNTSKGKIYPLIRRLRGRGLITAEPLHGARGGERLSCTERGREAVRRWLLAIRETHLLLEDPLRTRIQSFDLLSRDEQIEWLVDAKVHLGEKLRQVEEYGRDVAVPYQDLVHDNAVESLRSRLAWLDRSLERIVKAKRRSGAA